MRDWEGPKAACASRASSSSWEASPCWVPVVAGMEESVRCGTGVTCVRWSSRHGEEDVGVLRYPRSGARANVIRRRGVLRWPKQRCLMWPNQWSRSSISAEALTLQWHCMWVSSGSDVGTRHPSGLPARPTSPLPSPTLPAPCPVRSPRSAPRRWPSQRCRRSGQSRTRHRRRRRTRRRRSSTAPS